MKHLIYFIIIIGFLFFFYMCLFRIIEMLYRNFNFIFFYFFLFFFIFIIFSLEFELSYAEDLDNKNLDNLKQEKKNEDNLVGFEWWFVRSWQTVFIIVWIASFFIIHRK